MGKRLLGASHTCWPVLRFDHSAHPCKPTTGRAGNLGPSTAPITVTIDTTPPTITSLIVPARAIPDFAVSWSAQDNLTGVSHYDVQYKSESSGWTDWVSTPVTQALFTGPGGHVYTFRVSATDGVGNESDWQPSGQVTVSLVKKYYAAAGRRVAMQVPMMATGCIGARAWGETRPSRNG